MNSGKTHAFFSWAADHAMVPHWDYSTLKPSESDGTDTPVPNLEWSSRDRLQQRSRSASVFENHLTQQRFIDGASVSHVPFPHQLDVEDMTGVPQENPWSKPVYRGERHPDYIVKADEDSFIVLGELERRLRVAPRRLTYWGCE